MIYHPIFKAPNCIFVTSQSCETNILNTLVEKDVHKIKCICISCKTSVWHIWDTDNNWNQPLWINSSCWNSSIEEVDEDEECV